MTRSLAYMQSSRFERRYEMIGLSRVAGFAFALVALSGCFVRANDSGDSSDLSARRAFHKTFRGPITALHLSNVSGFVHVDTWNKPMADVSATMSGRSNDDLALVSVTSRQEGGALTIKADRHGSNFFGNDNERVDFTVHVPAGAATRISSVSGDVVVNGVRAPLRVNNVSGDVAVTGASSDLHVTTVSGDIDLTMAKLASPQVVTTNAVSGSTTLHVPADASATVSANSLSGRFRSTYDLKVDDQTVGTSAHGTIGRGRPATITLGSVSGSIRVEPKT